MRQSYNSAGTMQIDFFLTFQPGFTRSTASLVVREGRLLSFSVVEGCAQVSDSAVTLEENEATTVLQVRLEISEAVYGRATTIVHWQAESGGFSFLPYLLAKEKTIAIPDLGVVISRTKEDAAASAKRTPDFSQTPTGRGITWDYWAARNIHQEPVPTLLGTSRDQRFFVLDYATDRITASLDLLTTSLQYSIGHVAGADTHTRRSLERGYLPILRTRQQVGDLVVEDTAFVSFADQPLTESDLVGTPLALSHLGSYGGTFPGDGRTRALEESATRVPAGELVLFLRTRVTNTGRIPLLASTPLPRPFLINQAPVVTPDTGGLVKEFGGVSTLDERGVYWSDNRPLSLHHVDGRIATSAQPATLLSAGETFTVDSILAHDVKGLSPATQQAPIAWDEKLAEAIVFWEAKLAPAAQIAVPEDRLNHFWKAGLCHLELVTLGETAHGALLPKVGIYTAIGSESLPMIEFYHSVGLADTARRCTESFFEFQKETGRLNMYLYYDIETGGGL